MKRLCLIPLCIVLLLSCSPKNQNEETTTKGHLRVLVAEPVASAIGSEVAEFMRLYQERGADVTFSVVSSEEANRRFVHDTARMIITTIPLTQEEKDAVSKTTDDLAEITLAFDGVAAIVHEKNPVDEMSLRQIRGILDGTITSWDRVRRASISHNKIQLILQDSADVQAYLSIRVLGGGPLRVAPEWTSDPIQTIREVAKNRWALGFVSTGWLDSVSAGTKSLALSADSAFADTAFKPPQESLGQYFIPHPAYIYLGDYPMKRAIYLYARTSLGDFATGFASFLSSPAGQKIFLQKGLVPGTQKIVLKPNG